jgi:hypothetical protein
MMHEILFLAEQNLSDARVTRQFEKCDEHVTRHGDISEKQNGDEPADAREPIGFFVKQPRVKSEKTEVTIEQRRDEPRMRDDVVRRFPKRALRARPTRGAHHCYENKSKSDAKKNDHDSCNVGLFGRV